MRLSARLAFALVLITELAFAQTPPRVVVTPPLQPSDRYTGPFCSSELGRIKVELNGPAATWYYASFVGQPTWPFIQRYLRAGFNVGILPADVPGGSQPPRHVPGTLATTDGMQDMRFALSCLRYRSRYGGSIELLFRLEETNEYEARQGNILWDLDDVELSLFIVPRYQQFNNAIGGNLGSEPLYMELRAGAMTAYQINQALITVDADPHRAAFETLWTTVADANRSQAVNRFRISSSAFVYGFIHELFQSRLSGTNKIAMLELGDDHLGITTTAGIPMVSIAANVVVGDFSTGVFLQGLALDLTLTASWNSSLTSQRRFDLVSGSDTVWKQFFVFPLSNCPAAGSPSIALAGTFREFYPGFVIETPISPPNGASVDCQALQAAANAGLWGSQGTQPIPVRIRDSGGSEVASFRIQVQTTLSNR